jgi:hypothetical protein
LVLCAVAGVASGLFGAYAYSSSTYRPLAHTLGVWILLTALVSARQPWRQAMVRATTVLVTAVAAFYGGKEVRHVTRFSAEFTPDPVQLGLWLAVAAAAGCALGAAFHRIGTAGAAAAVATATAAGLLVADLLRRTLNYPREALVLGIFTGLALIALWLRARPLTRVQLSHLLLLLPLTTAVGCLLVSMPDLMEDLVLFI